MEAGEQCGCVSNAESFKKVHEEVKNLLIAAYFFNQQPGPLTI